METEENLIPYQATDPTGQKVLVLAPHPDDETIGCGGSVIRHTEAGDPVKIVFLTNGAKGDISGKMPREGYIRWRREEAEKACAQLGVTDMEFWGYQDRSLAGSHGALRRLIELIEGFRPQLIYAPSPMEIHPDHRAASFLLYDAIRSSDLEFQVAFYEIGQPVRVNLLVDITNVLEKRIEAIACYESQLKERPYQEVSISLNRYRSITLPESMTHAEGFFLCKSALIRKIGPFSLPFHRAHRLVPDSEEAGPLVSVIVRTKDRPGLLANALRSIANQTYANLEIVVVNDGGQEVRDVVDTVVGNVPVTYVALETSRGRSAAANKGLEAARGMYLNFLDDDDVFYPHHVQSLMQAAQVTGRKVIYAGVFNAYYEGPPENPRNCVRKEMLFNKAFDPDLLLFANYIPLMSILFHRDVFKILDPFDPELDLFEDWEFLIRASRGFNFHHVDEVTAEYRFYGVKDLEASHRGKYAYDRAQAALFDRVVPLLTGEAWLKFLESDLPYELGRKQPGLDKRTQPIISELKEVESAVDALRTDYQNLNNELAVKIRELESAITTVREVQASNQWLGSLLKESLTPEKRTWLYRFRELKTRLHSRDSR